MTAHAPTDDMPMSWRLAALLSFVGGFLDAYTYIGRGGVFSGAQTGNIVLVAAFGAQGDWAKAFRHVPSIVAFMIGVLLADAIKRRAITSRPALTALLIEIAVLFGMGLVPPNAPDSVVTSVVSLVAGVQLAAFGKLGRWSYNSTMTTGDLRSTVQAGLAALLDHDHEMRVKAVEFAGAVLAFAAGAAVGGLLTLAWHDMAIWGAALVLCGTLLSTTVRRDPGKPPIVD